MSEESTTTNQWRSASFWLADIWAILDHIENQVEAYRPSDRKDFLRDVMEELKTHHEKESK